MSTKQSNRRNVEGTGKAVTHGKPGKEKVAAPRAMVVTLRLGTAIGEAIAAHIKQSGTVLEKCKALATENRETQEQAIKELRQHQYTAQAAIVGKVWKEGMASADFMAKSGTTHYRQQRSIAANYSRAIALCTAIMKKENLANIMKATSMDMAIAYARRSGSTSDPEKRLQRPMQAPGYEAWDKQADRLIVPKADGTLDLSQFESHLMHCVKLAEKVSHLLSTDVRKVLGIKGRGNVTPIHKAA